jgi:protein-tyrosine phosphatase
MPERGGQPPVPEVLDWRRLADPRAAVRRAARALRVGGLVALPTEGAYALAAGGLAPAAVDRLAGLADPPALALRGAAEARDWVPGLSPLGQRLARRFWPGPLTLLCVAGVGEGLAGRLPEAVRRRLCPDGSLRLRAPAHDAALAVLYEFPGPLVLAAAPAGAAPDTLGADLVIDDGPGPQAPPTVVAVNGDGWRVVAEGAVSAEALARQSACLVVFVCTGNTCRSPLAEALCKRRLAERVGCAAEELPARGYFVLSAGLAAAAGGAAAPEAVEVARAYGADLAGHRSRPLTADLAAQADYLVAMTRDHLEALAEQFPRSGVRPRLLSPSGDDLPDPLGHPPAVYEACGRQIWGHLGALAEEVCPGRAGPGAAAEPAPAAG